MIGSLKQLTGHGLVDAVVFLLGMSALAKADSWGLWSSAVHGWLPRWLPARLVLFGLPFAEASVAATVATHPVTGLVAATVLMAGFGLGALLLIPTQSGKDCGCFGAVAKSRIGPVLAIRNLLLAAVAWLAAQAAKRLAIRGPGVPEILILMVVGLLLVLLVEFRRTSVLARPRMGHLETS